MRGLKNLLSAMAILALLTSALCSCSVLSNGNEQDNTLSINTEKKIPGKVAFTIEKVERTDFITTQAPPTYLSYFSIEQEDYEFLDIGVTIENLTNESAAARDLADVSVIIGSERYKADCAPEYENGTDFYPDETVGIPAGESAYVHYFIRAESVLLQGDVKLYVTSGKKSYTVPVSYNQMVHKVSAVLNKGDSLDASGCTATLVNFDSASRIQPENAGKEFNFYEVSDESNILFITEMEVHNKTNKKQPLDGLMAICVKDGLDRYFSTTVVENEEKTMYVKTADTYLEAGETLTVYYVAEIPFSAVQDGMDLEIFAGGERYIIEYNKL